MYEQSAKLIAADVDNTLVHSDMPGDLIAEDARRALVALADRGIAIAVVSGRSFDEIMRALRNNDLLSRRTLPNVAIAEEREIYLKKNGKLVPLIGWNRWANAQERKSLHLAMQFAEELKAEAARRGYSVRHAPPHVPGENQMKDIGFATVEEAAAAVQWLQARIGEAEAPLRITRNCQGVGIRAARFGKGRVLLKVATMLDISPVEVLAIGDSHNDEDMLDGRFGFRSAAVANAEPAIKERVKANGGYVAAKPYGFGVAEILNQFFGV